VCTSLCTRSLTKPDDQPHELIFRASTMAGQQAVEADGLPTGTPFRWPLVEYHGLGCADRAPSFLLLRPQLNGGMLGARKASRSIPAERTGDRGQRQTSSTS
jgi:hypothetical protein